MAMQIEVQGLERLRRKLGRVMEPVGGLMKETVDFAHGEARTRAKPDVHAKGTIASQIKKELAPGMTPLSARVYSPGPIARVIEEGRKPGGKLPSVTNVGKWAAAHGLAARPFLVARAFQLRGTRGVFYMKKAAEDTRKKLPEFIGKAVQSIERNWGR